jgi:hypothetical protein
MKEREIILRKGKKLEPSYESLWIFPVYHQGQLMSVELIRLLNWQVKPDIKPYSAYLKRKK